MSGLEIAIPVISAVFALVSAFKDGGTIVEKIKDRRHRRGGPLPNDKLQRALHVGAEQIQQLREEGVNEFGDVFGRDAATADRLKDVTIVLQDSIIRQLAVACTDDGVGDFDGVTSTVIRARMEAVNILNDLYMSLQGQRVRAGQTTTVEPPTVPRMQTMASDQTISDLEDLPSSSFISSYEYNSPAIKARKGNWWDMFRRPSLGAGQALQRDAGPPSRVSPGDHELTTQLRLRPASTPLSPMSNARSSGPGSPQANRASTNLSILSPPSSPHEWSVVSEENEYAGLCKGAWYAQQMKLAKAMGPPSVRDYEWLYHCRKCKFRLLADGSRKGNPRFDDRVHVSSTIYFRLLFLWKSHISTKDETRCYKCLLCVLGRGRSNLYKGEDHLFEHIARHQDKDYSSTRVTGPLEIGSDKVTPATITTFDIYLPPCPIRRRSSFMLPESAMVVVDDNSRRMSALFQGDPFERPWAEEGRPS